jgi:hypothetical protein
MPMSVLVEGIMLVQGPRSHRKRPPEFTFAAARQLRGADTLRFADGVNALAMERKHH